MKSRHSRPTSRPRGARRAGKEPSSGPSLLCPGLPLWEGKLTRCSQSLLGQQDSQPGTKQGLGVEEFEGQQG